MCVLSAPRYYVLASTNCWTPDGHQVNRYLAPSPSLRPWQWSDGESYTDSTPHPPPTTKHATCFSHEHSHGHSPQPGTPASCGLMSSTSVTPDNPSALPNHQRWIQTEQEPHFIHKAAAWGSRDANHLDTRRVVLSLITGPLTQYLHWGDTTIKTAGFPTISFLTQRCADPCDLPKDGKLSCVIWGPWGFSGD